MVNPTLVAVDLINSFDRMQTPEHTEGTEGYIWAKSIISNQSEGRSSAGYIAIIIKIPMRLENI